MKSFDRTGRGNVMQPLAIQNVAPTDYLFCFSGKRVEKPTVSNQFDDVEDEDDPDDPVNDGDESKQFDDADEDEPADQDEDEPADFGQVEDNDFGPVEDDEETMADPPTVRCIYVFDGENFIFVGNGKEAHVLSGTKFIEQKRAKEIYASRRAYLSGAPPAPGMEVNVNLLEDSQFSSLTNSQPFLGGVDSQPYGVCNRVDMVSHSQSVSRQVSPTPRKCVTATSSPDTATVKGTASPPLSPALLAPGRAAKRSKLSDKTFPASAFDTDDEESGDDKGTMAKAKSKSMPTDNEESGDDKGTMAKAKSKSMPKAKAKGVKGTTQVPDWMLEHVYHDMFYTKGHAEAIETDWKTTNGPCKTLRSLTIAFSGKMLYTKEEEDYIQYQKTMYHPVTNKKTTANTRAHVVVMQYKLLKEGKPVTWDSSDFHVSHDCHFKGCVNPDHLQLVLLLIIWLRGVVGVSAL